MDWQYRLYNTTVYLYNGEKGYTIRYAKIVSVWDPREVVWELIENCGPARRDGINKFLSILAKEKL